MGKRRRRAARAANQRPERRQDPRLTAERISAIGGVPVTEETWAVVIAPVELPDGRVMGLPTPQTVAMNLVEGKRHARRGSAMRARILGKLHKGADDLWRPPNTGELLDCLVELSAAVIFSFTALEGLGNHSIDQLEEAEVFVEVERRGELIQVKRDDMVRTLNISEKLDLVIPLLTGRPSIKGRAEWAKYKRLKRLRDDLTHVKGRGYSTDPTGSPDPASPAIYGRLIRGAADSCGDDAFEVVRAARSEFLPEHVLEELQK